MAIWRRMGLEKYTGDQGLRLPDDPGLLAGNYLRRYAEATGQALQGTSTGVRSVRGFDSAAAFERAVMWEHVPPAIVPAGET